MGSANTVAAITEVEVIPLIMIGIVKLYILIIIVVTLTFIQGHTNARKQILVSQLSRKVLPSMWMECDVLLRLVGLINLSQV